MCLNGKRKINPKRNPLRLLRQPCASRTLVGKTFRTGFYWPTALKDAKELVRQCRGCQMFARQAHVPAHDLICIPPTWPFAC
jgi:hypothetical protein